MYSKIMVPVDLKKLETLERVLQVAADIAKLYGAELHYISVTSETPSELGKRPSDFAKKLEDFANQQADRHGVNTKAYPVASHDPAADLNRTLSSAGDAIGADLIIMASHIPGFIDHIFRTHGGYVATHSGLSVFLVR
jgi:nucleotide-binding universal stress UspA family protein